MPSKVTIALIWMLTILALLLVALPACTTPQRGQKLIKAACPSPEILVYTYEDWSRTDERALERATSRCRDFYPNSPCLKRFERMEQHRYRAVCASESEIHNFDMWVE